jgi:hypothetical protein
MDQNKEIKEYDGADFQFFEKQPSIWPRVIGIGILGLIAVLLVAYTTFEAGSIAVAFIGEQSLTPYVLVVVVLVTIALLLQLS